jgi:hypothetical protein
MHQTRGDRDRVRDTKHRSRRAKLGRLGVSERLAPNADDPQSARSAARWIFLLAVARVRPEVLSDLRQRGDMDLDGWIEQFHLPLWVLPYATWTRRFWSEHPQSGNYWIGSDLWNGKGRQITDDQPDPHPPEYHPRWQTREDYLQRVAEYVRLREGTPYAAAGEPRPLRDPRHWTWLARHVVCDESYADLWRADNTGLQRSAIREACVSLARFIEITLPTNKRDQK